MMLCIKRCLASPDENDDSDDDDDKSDSWDNRQNIRYSLRQNQEEEEKTVVLHLELPSIQTSSPASCINRYMCVYSFMPDTTSKVIEVTKRLHDSLSERGLNEEEGLCCMKEKERVQVLQSRSGSDKNEWFQSISTFVSRGQIYVLSSKGSYLFCPVICFSLPLELTHPFICCYQVLSHLSWLSMNDLVKRVSREWWKTNKRHLQSIVMTVAEIKEQRSGMHVLPIIC